MSWTCQLLNIVGTKHITYDPPIDGICGQTVFVDDHGNEHTFKSLPIGSMFYLPIGMDMNEWPWCFAEKDDISEFYFQNNSHRQPLFVILPGRTLFLVDGKCWNSGHKYGGWQVQGEAPNITVTPSINIGGSYHGWLQNGVISDDCEGRTF
jgi:hypothetical protein